MPFAWCNTSGHTRISFHCYVVLEGQDAIAKRLWFNHLAAVGLPATQSVMLVAEEGLCHSALHASGHLDTVVVRLLGFDNVVELHRFDWVGTRVPPRPQAVGRLGQCHIVF